MDAFINNLDLSINLYNFKGCFLGQMENSLKLKRGNATDQARTCLHIEATTGDIKPNIPENQQGGERSTYSMHINLTLKGFQLLRGQCLLWRPLWLLGKAPPGRLPIHAAAYQSVATPDFVHHDIPEQRFSLCVHGPLNLAGRCPHTFPHKHLFGKRKNSFETANYRRNLIYQILP